MSSLEAFLMLVAIGTGIATVTWALSYVIDWIESAANSREMKVKDKGWD